MSLSCLSTLHLCIYEQYNIRMGSGSRILTHEDVEARQRAGNRQTCSAAASLVPK